MAEWSLADAENIRNSLTKEQEDEISKLYRRVYLEARKKAQAVPKDGTVSQQIQKQYLNKLQKQLDKAYKSLGVGLEKEIKKQAEKSAGAVVSSAKEWAGEIGLSIEGAWSRVPTDIVNALVTGQVYGGNWSLSSAIWSDIQNKQSDINTIIAEGVAANKSAYDIAKDLEKYVDPNARKAWDWNKVYPGTAKKVDYNAQRLARTMVSHAYQQSLERVCKKNPFVTGYIWHSSGTERMCDLCEERDGQFFPKGDLPMDHPNGMCTFSAEIPDSMEDIADRLADWANGGEDADLDKWYTDMTGTKESPNTSTQKWVSGKDLSSVWERREAQFDFSIEDIMNAQGFDGLPTVVSKADFNNAVKDSDLILQRVYSAVDDATLQAYRESLYSGKWYVDCSTGDSRFGQGMYCVSDYNGKLSKGVTSEIQKYEGINNARGSKESYIETMTLSKDAKIINYKDVIKEKINLINKMENQGLDESKVDTVDGLDEGSIAALLGYDAIRVDGFGDSGSYTVVLNRTKLIIEEP